MNKQEKSPKSYAFLEGFRFFLNYGLMCQAKIPQASERGHQGTRHKGASMSPEAAAREWLSGGKTQATNAFLRSRFNPWLQPF